MAKPENFGGVRQHQTGGFGHSLQQQHQQQQQQPSSASYAVAAPTAYPSHGSGVAAPVGALQPQHLQPQLSQQQPLQQHQQQQFQASLLPTRNAAAMDLDFGYGGAPGFAGVPPSFGQGQAALLARRQADAAGGLASQPVLAAQGQGLQAVAGARGRTVLDEV